MVHYRKLMRRISFVTKTVDTLAQEALFFSKSVQNQVSNVSCI